MNVVLDTSVLAKAMFPPRRRKKDELYDQNLALHEHAKNVLKRVESGEDAYYAPQVTLVEIAAVGTRLTGQSRFGLDAVEYVRDHAHFVSEIRLIDDGVEVAAQTAASGFDSLFVACARVAESVLITDDKGMHEAAGRLGVPSRLLRECLESKD